MLIGTTGLAVADYQNTPLGERMPGSEIHAQVLENLYDQTWLIRPRWAPRLELALFVLLGLLLIWATPRWKPRNAALLALGCIALPIAAGIVALSLAQAGVRRGGARARPADPVQRPARADAGRGEPAAQDGSSRWSRRSASRPPTSPASLRRRSASRPGSCRAPDFLRDDPRIELAAAMTPAREVGGDLYDFFLLDADRLFFLIGDVAGKGVSASMFMAVSKALYKSTSLRSPQATISDLMRAANEEVSRDNPEMFFVTAFAGVLDLDPASSPTATRDTKIRTCSSRRATASCASPTAPDRRLCTVERFAYRNGDRRLRPGELLCLVTDGVVDAQNPAGERYGSQRLQAVFARVQDGETTRARWSTRCAPTFARSRRAPSQPTTSRCWRCAGSDRSPRVSEANPGSGVTAWVPGIALRAQPGLQAR